MKNSGRSPLLWLFLPIALGFLAGPFLSLNFSFLSIAPALLGLGFLLFTRGTKELRLFIFFISSFIGALLYYPINQNTPQIQLLDLPEREIICTLKIEKVFKQNFDNPSLSGIGHILKAPSHLDYLTGQKVFLTLKDLDESKEVYKSSIIDLRGVISPNKKPSISDLNFSFQQSLSLQGIHYKIFRIELQKVTNSHFYQGHLHQLRKWIHHLLLREPFFANNKDFRNTLLALITGEKTYLPLKEEIFYKLSGTMHLFTISGLHIGIIALALHKILTFIIGHRFTKSFLILLTLLLIVELTGGKTAAYRAFWMSSIFLLAPLLSRKFVLFNSLLVAAFLELLVYPSHIWSLSFQLSYSVVLSIILVGLPVNESLKKYFNPYQWTNKPSHWRVTSSKLGQSAISALVISTTAFIPSTLLLHPLMHSFSPYAILLNLLLIPIVTVLLPVVLGSIPIHAFFSSINSSWNNWIYFTFDLIIGLMSQIIEWTLHLPYGVIYILCVNPSLSKILTLSYVAMILFIKIEAYQKLIAGILMFTAYYYIMT